MLRTDGAHVASNLYVWGDDASHQVSNAPLGSFRAVAGGSFNGLALRQDGTPVFWGFHEDIGPRGIPADLVAEKFTSAALGRDDAVLIRRDGTLAAFGQTPEVTSYPAGSYRAVTVAARHAVAVATMGTLTTWGADPGNRGVLNAPSGGPFTAVSARVLYSLALHANGTLYFWGSAPDPAFLNGWTPTREGSTIYVISGESFKAIAAGNTHAVAIRRNGTITGWGSTLRGELAPPTHVRFKEVAAGWGYSIGLDTDGKLWGWGTPFHLTGTSDPLTFASQGWSRHGDSEHYYVPDLQFTTIAAAAFHVMALTDDR